MAGESQDVEVVAPDPAALVESLRAFGYSVETSIADLIDNSITAGSSVVHVDFYWKKQESMISIRDNGRGMTEDELREAMRPGSSNPLSERDSGDLGRFGLGLKTASFSQARSLTVGSRRGGGPVALRRWDLDHVGLTGRWELLKSARSESLERFAELGKVHSGTIVLWELLDRIVSSHVDAEQVNKDNFYRIAAAVSQHLGAVFHRFIRSNKLQLFVNRNEVVAWDPFLEGHSATQRLPSERQPMPSGYVTVKPYVLPHHGKLTTAEHSEAAGTSGWNAAQGFYVYRADRLIQAGGWLSLGIKAEEHYKLARIAIDISQDMDAEWDIDVRKARCRPPAALRKDLKRVAKTTRSRAQDIYRHRAKRLNPLVTANKKVDVWVPKRRDGKTSYVLNTDHGVIAEGLKMPPAHRKRLRAILHLVEQTVPVERIYVDGMEDPQQHVNAVEVELSPELLDFAKHLYNGFRTNGLSVSEAQQRVLALEPFGRFPEVVFAMEEEG